MKFLIFCGGFVCGLFIMWIWTRPEPNLEKDDKSISGMVIPHPYLDEDEWNGCMKECSAYCDEEHKDIKNKRRKKK